MADEDKTVSEVVKALAKQIYGDMAAPAAREIGGALGDLMHAMRVSGVEFGAISRERATAVFDRALNSIPKERRLMPPPQIAGPVFEGLRYEPDDTTIAQMFEALLSASMDKDRVNTAHPSYPNIIKQISSDEAHLLMHLLHSDIQGEVVQPDGKDPYFQAENPETLPSINIENLDFYIDHLASFGFVDTSLGKTLDSSRVYEGGRADMAAVGIQPLGRRFIRTCRPQT